MPRATRATKRAAEPRPAPYPTRSVSNTSQAPIVPATVPSPMVNMGWDQTAQPPYYMPRMDAQQHQQYDHYQQQVQQSYYSSIPTPISGALPVQPALRTPMTAVPSHQPDDSGQNIPWSAQLDDILLECRPRHTWDQIAKIISRIAPKKTANACRKRHSRLLHERQDPARWEPEKVQAVIDVYMSEGMRERIWRPLADAVKEDWQHIEKLCYSQGIKQMTGKTQPSHRRRTSRAVSHRSQHSFGSSVGNDATYNDNEDQEDDSGLGTSLPSEQQPLQMPADSYGMRESYPPAPYQEYQPEGYYRGYQS